jgi:SAM-dependent methyltransferase
METTVPFAPVSRGGMSFLQRKVLDRFYAEAAGDPERLPWHRAEPDPFLARVVAERAPGRALDVGCGSGVFAAYLAARGYAVTAIDLHPEAVAMARRRAASGPAFEVVEADALTHRFPHRFDLVLDSGCLHTLGRTGVRAYRGRLLEWLAPDGDFVLEHWDRRHRFDWRPVGPARRSPATIQATFAPELTLVDSRSEEFAVPLPLGPRVRGTVYHLRRLSSRFG